MSEPSVTENMGPPKVAQRITDAGFYYRLRSGGEELGCFTVEDEESPQLDQTLASKLNVDLKEILAARLYELRCPTTFDQVADVLGCTIRHDKANKLILFAACLLTFTDEDQFNVLMSSESASGKTYSALEVVSYFPSEIVRTIGNASPTAFFHMEGEWDKENHLIRVDLRQKILVFLDQMHYSLQERLRPMLSHDRKELTYLITDKSKRGSLRTKKIVLLGFMTAIFCAAKLSLDEQERTRVFILSPETSQEKLEETILLRIKHDGDRETFKHWVDTHPRRRWLKSRIDLIRAAKIDQIIIEDQEAIYNRFLETHAKLAPRHQRDISRILALIKAHALLNWCHRERPQPNTIVANEEDVDAGFWLYGQVAKSNELGLSPQVYEIYRDIILPNLSIADSLRKERIAGLYYKTHGRHLPWKQLDRNILPALEASGLISLQPDPDDRRRIVVCPPDEGNISPSMLGQNNIAPMWGTPPNIVKTEGQLDKFTNPGSDGFDSLRVGVAQPETTSDAFLETRKITEELVQSILGTFIKLEKESENGEIDEELLVRSITNDEHLTTVERAKELIAVLVRDGLLFYSGLGFLRRTAR